MSQPAMPPPPPMPTPVPQPPGPPPTQGVPMFQKPVVIGVVVAVVVSLLGVGLVVASHKTKPVGGPSTGPTTPVSTTPSTNPPEPNPGPGAGSITLQDPSSNYSLSFSAASGWDCSAGSGGQQADCSNSAGDYEHLAIGNFGSSVQAKTALELIAGDWLSQDGYTNVRKGSSSDVSQSALPTGTTSGALLAYEAKWTSSQGASAVGGFLTVYERQDGEHIFLVFESNPDLNAAKAHLDAFLTMANAVLGPFGS